MFASLGSMIDVDFGDMLDFLGKGLGHKLVEVLIEIAREKGLEDIQTEVLTENKRMLTVLRRLGFTTQWLPGGTSEAVLKLKE
jgi:acetyltransferase